LSEQGSYDERVGAKLRALRQRYLLKQEQLAAAVGMQKAAVARWERGTRGLTVDLLLQLADRFGVRGYELLPDEHQPPAVAAPASQPASPPPSPYDAAIESVVRVLRERPDLIFVVMDAIEQASDAQRGPDQGEGYVG
jgi:transcriptional regulator with XRE-family HTH domain